MSVLAVHFTVFPIFGNQSNSEPVVGAASVIHQSRGF